MKPALKILLPIFTSLILAAPTPIWAASAPISAVDNDLVPMPGDRAEGCDSKKVEFGITAFRFLFESAANDIEYLRFLKEEMDAADHKKWIGELGDIVFERENEARRLSLNAFLKKNGGNITQSGDFFAHADEANGAFYLSYEKIMKELEVAEKQMKSAVGFLDEAEKFLKAGKCQEAGDALLSAKDCAPAASKIFNVSSTAKAELERYISRVVIDRDIFEEWKASYKP